MANTNTLTTLITTLLAQGLMSLREMAIMPRLVNRSYENTTGVQFSTITVNKPAEITAQSVSPSNTPPDDAGTTPTSVTISLDKWYRAPFFMSDKEMKEVMEGSIPMIASSAIRALANQVDNDILALYVQFYGYAGVAGTAPFATSLSEFLAAEKALNEQLAPMAPRFVVLDSAAVANARDLRAVQDASYRADPTAMRRNDLGSILGADWSLDQNIPTHTAGTATGATTDASGYALGIKSITLASAGSGTLVIGDIFTIAGDTQTYVTTAADAEVSNGGTLAFEPGLKVAITTSATAITLKASHTVNLAFHQDAIAFVTRPFDATDPTGLGQFVSAVDPVSGLALRLEISRQHYRTSFQYDILYGTQVLRREYGARIAG